MANRKDTYKFKDSETKAKLAAHGSVGDQNLVANKDMYIEFMHIASKRKVRFKAFITAFDDSFQANWETQSVYGRMDPMATFQGTERQINMQFDVPSVSLEEAKANMHRIENLTAMMYPLYSPLKKHGIETVKASPLMRVKFANLIKDASSSSKGLPCVVQTVSFVPNMEDGFFMPGTGMALAKSYSVNVSMIVLHAHKLGWHQSGADVKWRSYGGFPYGVGNIDTVFKDQGSN